MFAATRRLILRPLKVNKCIISIDKSFRNYVIIDNRILTTLMNPLRNYGYKNLLLKTRDKWLPMVMYKRILNLIF